MHAFIQIDVLENKYGFVGVLGMTQLLYRARGYFAKIYTIHETSILWTIKIIKRILIGVSGK